MSLELKRQKKRKKAGLFLKVTTALLLLTTIPFPASATTDINTVFHVYIDDTYAGVISDKEVVNKAVIEVIEENQEQYEDLHLQLGNKITYIPEQVFWLNANNEAVSNKIEELGTVKALVTAITADDEQIAYLKDINTAESVVETIQTQYVPKEDLEAFNEQQQNAQTMMAMSTVTKEETDKSLPSGILNIATKENLKYEVVAVDPDEVMSSKDAVQLLKKGTLEEKTHIVKEGEVFGRIAAKYGLTNQQLEDINKGVTEESILQIGQELNVLVTKPLLNVLVEKEVYKEEAVGFETEVVENSSLPKGETRVKQQGKNGKSGITYKIVEQNGKEIKKEVLDEKVISKPVKKIIEKGTKVIPSRGTGSFTWPTNGGYISSVQGQRWGKLHKGIDIARPSNYTIKAADHGIVVFAGWHGGYGNKIIIDHQNGYRTVYAHLRSISVSKGQKVEKGSKIGIMGSTGDSTGTHLHFEIYKNGALKNPLSYF